MRVQPLSEREPVRPVLTLQREEVETPCARLALSPAVPHPVLPVARAEAAAVPSLQTGDRGSALSARALLPQAAWARHTRQG